MTEAASPPNNAAAPPSGEQVEPAKTEAAPAAPPAPRKHKVIDGDREVEVTDAEYIDRMRSMYGDDGMKRIDGLTTQGRRILSEAGLSKKQITEAAGDLKDRRKVMQLLTRIHGQDGARAIVEEWYAGDVESRNKDPKLRDLDDREAKLTARERAIEEADRREHEKATQARVAEIQPELEAMFGKAVEQHGVKLTRVMQSRMAKLVEDEVTQLRSSGHRVSNDDFRQIVLDAGREVATKHWGEVEGDFPNMPAEKRTALVRSTLAKMTPADIYAAIGEQRMREFRRWDLDEAKRRRAGTAPAKPLAPQPKPAASNGAKGKGPVSIDDWLPER
jgi:hypothetical protein